MSGPPRFAEWVLSRLLAGDEREFITGDLKEIYRRRRDSSGPLRARAWYWGQIFRSLRPFLSGQLTGSTAMFKNYWKLALRSMGRHLGYSLLNISGLAIGMACCILIFLWVRHEISYDRFHEKIDNLQLITIQGSQGIWNSSPWALIPALKRDYPEIVRGSCFGPMNPLTRYEDDTYYEKAAMVEADFFGMFSFALLKGRPETVFSDPFSVILTESAAEKYFGEEEPIGKVIQFQGRIDLTVTGVVENVPDNSSLEFDVLVHPIPFMGEARMQTWSMDYPAVVELTDAADAGRVEEKISGIINQRDGRTNTKFFVGLFPFVKNHLYALNGTDPILYVYVFCGIAVMVLLIACINFMNLTTARSSIRVSEIGIRRVLGGVRRDLVKQFIGESVGLAFIALIAAVILVQGLLPAFNAMARKQLGLDMLAGGFLPAGLVLFALLTGVIAGSWPALHFSSFQPQQVLKTGCRTDSSKSGLRKALIIFQFAASILLIITTLTIHKQIRYIQGRDLGFDRDRILVVRAERALREKYDTVKQRLRANPDIPYVSAASSLPLRINNNNPVYWEGRGPDRYISMNFACVDFDYFETFDMSMSHGRSFSEEYPTDKENYIINQAALELTGYEDPVGRMFSMWKDEGRIVGVVKDFHGTSLHNDIRPVVFVMYQNMPYRYWFIKVRENFVPKAVDFVKKTVAAVVPGYPIEPTFLDEDFQSQYEREGRLGRILNAFTMLAVFISCLGLFGLAAFMASRRSKEIAVRKILGAGTWRIMGILNREFAGLILAAGLLAGVPGYLIMTKWLRNFAYHTVMGAGIFLMAGIGAMGIALLTVSWQTFRAAGADPADRLRVE